MFNKPGLFDLKNILMMSICQDDKLIKGCGLLQFRRWSQIALSFDGLSFLNAESDIPIYSPDQTFKCLSVSQ